MTVGIERVHDASTCLHTTVEKQFNPPRYDACGFKLFGINGSCQSLVHVHPALNLVGQTQHEVQLACLVKFLGCLIVIGVDEIVTPTLTVHRISHRMHVLLDFSQVGSSLAKGIQVIVVEE